MSTTTQSETQTETPTEVDVVLCTQCGGTGTAWAERVVEYHRNLVERTPHECHLCQGSGRLIATTNFRPFVGHGK